MENAGKVKHEDLFTYPTSGLIAQTTKIKERPDEIKRETRAGIKNNRKPEIELHSPTTEIWKVKRFHFLGFYCAAMRDLSGSGQIAKTI